MNITFLVGNGFDLNLGLRTLYSHFLDDYLDVNEINPPLIASFKKNIEMNLETWASAELAFGQYTRDYSGESGREDFLTCHSDFKIALGKYLENQEERLHYDLISVELRNGFINSLLNLNYGFRAEPSAKLKAALDSVGGGFDFQFISFNYTQTLDECVKLASTNSTYIGHRKVNGNNFQNTLGKVHHVHGYTSHDMILAVNDESQIANNDLFKNADEEDLAPMIKQLANKVNEERTDEIVSAVLTSSDFIYIYGMSIGETDKLWWQRILSLMVKNPKLHVIIHQNNAPALEPDVRKFRKYQRTLLNKFVSFSDVPLTDDTIEDIKSRILITKANVFYRLTKIVDSKKNKQGDLAPSA